jgi:hypothetical protein
LAYRLAGSFNNFHGRLTTIFHLLSDDKVGSTPRFAPGSKANPDTSMEVETVDDVSDEVVEVAEDAPAKHTPSRGISGQLKRKAGQLFSGTDQKANKIKPT